MKTDILPMREHVLLQRMIVLVLAACILASLCSMAMASPRKPLKPPREGRKDQPRGKRYSIEQAISERAQLHTIAYNGLAFLTGDFGASTFIPPGKVCDFFGFQYMRDVDVAGKGHNPMFLGRVAGNVHGILTPDQRNLFMDLAEEQAGQLESLAMMRFPLIKAFHQQRDGAIPQGSQGLNQAAVKRYTGQIFTYDAELSYRRAEVFGQVAVSLSAEQKAFLGRMKFGDFSSWPDVDEREIKRDIRGRSRLYSVAYMTYCSEFFSWYAGSVKADTYFCPERHGTYFGGFYMKDMPAMGKRDYDISMTVTGDNGEEFLNILERDQRKYITAIPDAQRAAMNEIVKVRRTMSRELRRFLSGARVDKQAILDLGQRYGELDGQVSWMYTMAFAEVNRTLTAEQKKKLYRLRGLEDYRSAPAYLYSEAMRGAPQVQNTDHFFFKPEGD